MVANSGTSTLAIRSSALVMYTGSCSVGIRIFDISATIIKLKGLAAGISTSLAKETLP